MADRSPLQIVSDNVFARIQSLRNEKVEGDVPFGMERVDRQTALTRLKKLSPEGRKRLIDKIGIDAVVDIVGKQNGNNR